MKTFHGITSGVRPFTRAKITVGTFDGVHRGHLRVLRQLLAWARDTDGEAVVVTFDRPPRSTLTGKPSGQIQSMAHRLLIFERLRLDAAVVLKFDPAFASQEPEDFVKETLVKRLGAEGILLGHDTRFGRGGRGDVALMNRMARELHFQTCTVPVVESDGSPISSTRLRSAIRAGDLRLAERMLGRRVSVFGAVVAGLGRGRTLGFPTLNLDLHHEVRPPQGVYATRSQVGGALLDSVTNIGPAPSLKPDGPAHLSEKVVVETHILDFSGDLYGQDVEVQFIERLRGEEVFTSAEALAERIAGDIRQARACLAHAAPVVEEPLP